METKAVPSWPAIYPLPPPFRVFHYKIILCSNLKNHIAEFFVLQNAYFFEYHRHSTVHYRSDYSRIAATAGKPHTALPSHACLSPVSTPTAINSHTTTVEYSSTTLRRPLGSNTANKKVAKSETPRGTHTQQPAADRIRGDETAARHAKNKKCTNDKVAIDTNNVYTPVYI